MSTEAASRLTRRYLVFTHVTSLTVIVIGSLVLLGWQLEITLLKSLLPSYATMKPNAAACFVLAGAALWLQRVGPGQRDSRNFRRTSIAQACAALVALVGLLTLGEYLFNLNIGLDELFFRDIPHPAHLTPPGRMAPATALGFVLLGSALVWLEAKSHWRHRLSQSLALLTTLVGLIAFLGYLYGAELLYRVFPYTSMALHTALLFLVLGTSMLSARPDCGLLALLTHEYAGSVMARRLLPIVIFLPMFIGWVWLKGQQMGLYSIEHGLALFATSTVVILATVVWCIARSLNQAEERTQQLLQTLEQVVKAAPSAMVMANAQGTITLINSQTEKLFGYQREELIGQPIELLVPERFRHHHPTSRNGFLEKPQARPMGVGRDLYARRKDGSEFPVEIGLNPLKTEEGRMVLSAIVDITAHKQAEDAIKASLKEKEILLKEIHHRVKNNLQTIVSLLNLQANTVNDPIVLQTFADSQHRIHAMALIHEQLYQTPDLAAVDLAEYARTLTAYLFRAYRDNGALISLKLETESVHLRMDTAIPCGLIVNELVSNALKHAFPAGRQGEISLSLRAEPEKLLTLRVSDDGVGFPSGLDFRQTRSLGLQLVTTLTEQLQGTIELQQHGGTAFQLRFPTA